MMHRYARIGLLALLAMAVSSGLEGQGQPAGAASAVGHHALTRPWPPLTRLPPHGQAAPEPGVTVPFSGTSWTQQAELTSTAQSNNDGYGETISISGNTAVVGAPGTPYGSSYGAVYIFTRTTSGVWSQQAELLDPQFGSGQDHFFGAAVALQGNVLVVGAWGATGVTTDTGAAYVYVRSGSTWTLQATLVAADGAYVDGFGTAVALSGGTIVVGADGKNGGAGVAYVFVYGNGAWQQQAEVPYPGHVGFAEFGYAVAVWGNNALIGAPITQGAFMYARSGASWRLQAVLTARHPALFYFGNAVALWGTTALVSAYDASTVVPGAAYVFTRSGRTWTLTAALAPPAGAVDSSFASCLALSGQTAVVGGDGAFVYAGSGSTWSEQAQLVPTDRPPHAIGAAVAVAGNTALIGATGAPPAGYVFVRSGAADGTMEGSVGGTASAPAHAAGTSAARRSPVTARA